MDTTAISSAVNLPQVVRVCKLHNCHSFTLGDGEAARHIPVPVDVRATFGRARPPVVVAINHFTADTAAEIAAIEACCARLGVGSHLCRHWAEGAAGARDLADAVAALCESGVARFAPLYPDAMPLPQKIETIASGMGVK